MKAHISDRLARSGRVLDVIGKVLAVICFITAALALFGAIAVAIIPDDVVVRILNLFNIENSASQTNTSPFILGVVGAKIGAILGLAGWAVHSLINATILLLLSSVFKSTAVDKTPFTLENAKRLKIIAIILIVASIPFGLGNLVFAFCVFVFAYVLQYGAELQQQADETL